MKEKYRKWLETDRICGRVTGNEKGFTLVELIVVLVILAILAAVLTPALLGYIDKARQEKEMTRASTLRDITQAELVELYGKNKGLEPGKTLFPCKAGKDQSATKKNGDVNASESDFAKYVLAEGGYDWQKEPYVYLIAVGSNYVRDNKDANASMHDKYTIFYTCLMETENSRPVYFYNGEWTTENPRNNGVVDGDNRLTSGDRKGLRLQYYLLSNKTGKNYYSNDFWDVLKKAK